MVSQLRNLVFNNGLNIYTNVDILFCILFQTENINMIIVFEEIISNSITVLYYLCHQLLLVLFMVYYHMDDGK